MSKPRVYADFQNLDDENRLRLTSAGTRADLDRQGIALREGAVITFYMDDADDEGRLDEMLAEGIVRFNSQEQCWTAEIDWGAVHHESDDLARINGVKRPPMTTVAENKSGHDGNPKRISTP